MYQTYKNDTGADALICFTRSNINFVYPFRDKVAERIQAGFNLYLHKSEGEPTKIDSSFSFFSRESEETAKSFLDKQYPGVIACIFRTKKWKDYRTQERRIDELVLLDMYTSHDHPCIEIYSSMHTESSLSELIESISEELNIDMVKNPRLPIMSDIIMTNKTFNL
jgi:hypothetical protein